MGRSRPEDTGAREMEVMEEQLEVVSRSEGIVSEAYRTLRTNLLHSFGSKPPGVIVLTSARGPMKRSSVSANLAVALTHVNKSTLLVDCDLRRPFVHKLFGLRNPYGLTDVILGNSRPQDVWQEPLPGLMVLTAGAPTPGAVDLLETSAFEDLLGLARQEFDCVLVDAPPMGMVSDATIIAPRGDGVLLLLDAREKSKEPVRQAVQELAKVGANVLGTVVCDANASKQNY